MFAKEQLTPGKGEGGKERALPENRSKYGLLQLLADSMALSHTACCKTMGLDAP